MSRHFASAGAVSYSIYPLHQPLLIRMGHWLELHHRHPLATFAICVSLWLPILFIPHFYYRLVEVPAMRWSKKIGATRHEAAVPAAACV